MRFIVLLVTILLGAETYAQSFQMQYTPISANEVQIITIYKGPSTEITLPARGRITALSEQEGLNVGGGTIRVGIRVGKTTNAEVAEATEGTEVAEATADEYTVRFTYSLLLSSGGFGGITANWYPTIKGAEASYSITALADDTGLLVYPYTEFSNATYSFTSAVKANLASFKYDTIQGEGTAIPVTIHTANDFASSGAVVLEVFEYLQEYFGAKNISEIVIINSGLMSYGDSQIVNDKLFLSMSGRGTAEQVKEALVNVWADKENLSARLFNMFKDSVLRLNPFTPKTSALATTAPTTATEGDTTTEGDATTTEGETAATTTTGVETDPGKIVMVPPVSYYQNLFTTGFVTNEIVNVNMEGIFNNYALLHMAYYDIGAESLLAGIKAYFNTATEATPAETPVVATEEVTPPVVAEDTTTDVVATPEETTDTVVKEEPIKLDIDYVDWATITQNKLQEPLYSLYTKEVLKPTGALVAHLIAKGKTVSRNSYNIPNFTLTDSEGNIVNVEWNDFLSVNVDVAGTGYLLDPERKVPQQEYLESYTTSDTAEIERRGKIIALAGRYGAPGEQSVRRHLDLMSIPVEGDNAFGVEVGEKVYVLVSHILSRTTGVLKPAVRESFFKVDADNNISHLATRVRI